VIAPAARLAVAVLASALLAPACTRKTPGAEHTSGPSATGGPSSQAGAGTSQATPPDHLAPGELVEGTNRAFDIALPRDMQVTQSFVDLVSATGPVSVHALARYLAARLEGGTLREGTESATFEHVMARGKPELELFVKIASVLGGSRVEIHKVTHQQVRLLPDEEARWRQVGLTPQGKVVDPSHAE
jgi:hypothetical protein